MDSKKTIYPAKPEKDVTLVAIVPEPQPKDPPVVVPKEDSGRMRYQPELRGLKVSVEIKGVRKLAYATFAGITPGSKPGIGDTTATLTFEDGSIITNARVTVPGDTSTEPVVVKGEDNMFVHTNPEMVKSASDVEAEAKKDADNKAKSDKAVIDAKAAKDKSDAEALKESWKK